MPDAREIHRLNQVDAILTGLIDDFRNGAGGTRHAIERLTAARDLILAEGPPPEPKG